MLLLKIAWRNVWRNSLRSFVVIASIAIGIWAGVFVLGLSTGLNNQRQQTAIDNTLSHIQIHNPDFIKDFNVQYRIPDGKAVHDELANNPDVRVFTERVILTGMISSANGVYAARISGVNPETEVQVTTLHEKLLEGEYLTGIKRNPVVISQRMAKKLNVKMKSKVVLTFQKDDGEIIAGAFRVAGIYKTISSRDDELNIYTQATDLHRLLDQENGYHEIAILLNDFDAIQIQTEALQAAYPSLLIRPWDVVSPELGYANQMMSQLLYLFIAIILFALSFGIINTMLMAVLERNRELAMLMSIGMNKPYVFAMIVYETIFISMIGGPLGVLLGYASITYYGIHGIDLSVVSEGLENFGVGSMVYTQLESIFYINVTIMVLISALLSSIYPAWKALKVNPAEGVRGI